MTMGNAFPLPDGTQKSAVGRWISRLNVYIKKVFRGRYSTKENDYIPLYVWWKYQIFIIRKKNEYISIVV